MDGIFKTCLDYCAENPVQIVILALAAACAVMCAVCLGRIKKLMNNLETDKEEILDGIDRAETTSARNRRFISEGFAAVNETVTRAVINKNNSEE